ncbi:hypothetical protein EVAR_32673_1 [Eumeta japonica]|uniref:Mariner Mos1 transposase n=1 Tax=Eumeta variegata TaxID=151549 RepID=A0A4C1VPN8_EUMVA|nr:hypothetical protein EVAR_32673_1 [Eumeta japonica]
MATRMTKYDIVTGDKTWIYCYVPETKDTLFGNFDVKEEARFGQPVTNNISSGNIAEELEIDYKTVQSHSKKAGYTKRSRYLGTTSAH